MDSKNNHKLNAPFDHKFSEFKGVVIDGANVLTKNKNKGSGKNKETEIVIQRLTKLIHIVEALGWSALVGLKSKSYGYMIKHSEMSDDDKSKLRKMVETGVIDLIDDEEDDYHLISVALNGPYYLLSHDRYKVWKKDNPKLISHIEKCQIIINWLGDEPSINLPANGKSTVIVNDNSSLDDALVLLHINKQQAVLAPYEKNIGRSWLASKFELESEGYISNQHFRFRSINGQLMIEDLSSTNGTYVDGLRLPPNHPIPIEKGVEFRVGPNDTFELKDV